MPLSEKAALSCLENPDFTWAQLDKADCQESLYDYMRILWPVLEPEEHFVSGWTLQAIAEHLQAVSEGEIRRLLMTVPPGFTKSLATDVFWPTWEWGPFDHPSRRFLSFSYSEKLTIRDNLRARDLIQSPLYQAMWGDRFKLKGDINAKEKFANNKQGWKEASSIKGMGTGARANRVVIDDPHNVKESESDAVRDETIRWLSEALPSRVSNKGSAIVLIMQPTHHGDAQGHIIAKQLGYVHLSIPMFFEKDHKHRWVGWRGRCWDEVQDADGEKVRVETCQQWGKGDPRTEEDELAWPERFDLEFVENDLVKPMGGRESYAVAAQLQMRPSVRGGGLFKRKNWQFLDKPPTQYSKVSRGWDLAASTGPKAKYTAATKMALVHQRGKLPMIVIWDVFRFRGSPHVVDDRILQAAEADGDDVYISIPKDPGQASHLQVAHFAQLLSGYRVRFTPEVKDKARRAEPLASQVEAGNVYLVRGPWNDMLMAEGEQFPYGLYTDLIDSASRAYEDLITKPDDSPGGAPMLLRGSK